ncbi:MAG: DUF1566 domain-containing protein [Paludibacter sp.]|nr:DUF1566 domain-containing protein [Paludibacter sp.]
MKRVFTFFAAVLFTATLWAQSPEKISYQAVIRNSSGVLETNTQIGMEINIRQGSVSGTVVYTETQTPTTNANGLVSIEIGGGAGFNTIDWSAGPYFIETKTDPAGGTNYTITGTSQLLSVPYALHAKTAETVSGGITETDPVFTAWDKNYNDLINKPTIDGSETKVTAGTNVTVTGSGTTVNPYVVNANGVPTLTIGQAYQGGIIFWLDATGQHGLIAATEDQGGERWWNGTDRFTGTDGDGLYAGAMNTAMIIATQMADNQRGNFAAKVCADYSVTDGGIIYGDWYLPSKYELNLLYQQKTAVGGFASGSFESATYWSSTETYSSSAWIQYFDDGSQSISTNKVYPFRVRAVRAF